MVITLITLSAFKNYFYPKILPQVSQIKQCKIYTQSHISDHNTNSFISVKIKQ